MSKATKKAMEQVARKEAELEKARLERRERDELEELNRKTEDHLARMQKMLWEQETKAAFERRKQQQKLQAVIDLVVLIFLTVVTCVSLIILSYTGWVAWWFSIVLTMGLMMACSLRTGWLWHEIKG
jgi:cation transport ATPase